jgi:hypothetical protein
VLLPAIGAELCEGQLDGGERDIGECAAFIAQVVDRAPQLRDAAAAAEERWQQLVADHQRERDKSGSSETVSIRTLEGELHALGKQRLSDEKALANMLRDNGGRRSIERRIARSRRREQLVTNAITFLRDASF